MKINGIGKMGMNPYNIQANKQEQVKSLNKANRDKLEISSEAKEMQGITEISTERQKKVEELKLQVENGTYKLDPKATAKGIVNYYSKN